MQATQEELVHKVRRRLADLYRLSGFQTKTELTVHPNRPSAVVLQLRRRKKKWDMFMLRTDFMATP